MCCPLINRAILLVTREMFVGLEIAQCLERAGAHVVIGDTLDEALKLADAPGWSAAVVNKSFCNGAFSLAYERMKSKGIPIVAYTGCDERYSGQQGAMRAADRTVDQVIALLAS